jgi:capsular exopolysaccharide synthesis family protein
MSPTRSEHPPSEAEAPHVSAVTAAAPAPDNSLTDSWVTIRKRKYVILGFALLGFIYGWYTASTQPRLYDAFGTIEIRNGSSAQYKLSNAAGTGDVSGIPTELAILKSNSLMLAVARDLNLANNPDFMGPSTVYRNVDDPAVRQAVVGALQAAVSAGSVPKTDLISIHCRTANPKLSADIVNKVVTDYIYRSLETSADAQKRVSDFFATQLNDLKQQVESSQKQLIDLQKRLGVLGFDPSLNQVTTNLGDLSKAAGAAELQRIEAETRYHVLASMDPGVLDQSAEGLKSTTISTLRTQLDTAESQLDQLSISLGPNNPKVKALQREIADLNQDLKTEENRILTETKQAYLASKAQEDQTNAVLEEQKNDAYKLRDDLLEYNLRQREFTSNRDLYEGLNQRLNTARVEAGLESTEIDIVDPALPPLAPTLKPRSSILIVDTVVMLVAGIIVAFLLDSLDTGLRTIAEIENVSGLPSLALIPRSRRTGPEAGASTVMRNIGLLSSPKSQFAEAFRALRTSLLLSIAGGEPKTILLSSATPSEGKTTVSINLACVLAQRNVRVLLIDADLRRPTVHHRFGLNGKVGLTSVLTGSLTLEEAIQRVPEIPMLDILVSGPVPPFPTEMLGSQTMHDLIEHCRGIYTHIVMDSPPLLSVTDSVVLAREADAVVMIVRHGKSSKHVLRRGRDLLLRSGSKVTGIVLNAVDLSSPEYYAYYGYYGYTAYSAAGVDSAGWEAHGDTPNSGPETFGDAPRRYGKRSKDDKNEKEDRS